MVDGMPDKTDTSGTYEAWKGYWGEHFVLFASPLFLFFIFANGMEMANEPMYSRISS
jgi:hypothetical protein